MTPRGAHLLTLFLLATALLAACKDKQPAPPPPPAKPAVQQQAEPAVTRDQAMAALLALPEVKSWSQEIEKRSRGKAHGAIIEDDPTPRVINGTAYWQLSFVENRADKVQRRESFLVARTGNQILVEDTATDTVVSLDEWRRGIRRVETKSAD
ncbi:hypothetical protein [Massilia sp. Mn16-1_5]|uniref:hypothetical protein n=1 Tax=Massilia sp. Mn16-1_5 TaxID=2079199 RepID=UPI001E493CE9|nr:hypothetical protein [Massilia sp. Mn16-1_5]